MCDEGQWGDGQQEAFVTFTGYQMFTRFVSFAMDECRNANDLTVRQLYPDHTVLTVNTAEPVAEELFALDTVGVCRRQPPT